jgi:hypothetical protein
VAAVVDDIRGCFGGGAGEERRAAALVVVTGLIQQLWFVAPERAFCVASGLPMSLRSFNESWLRTLRIADSRKCFGTFSRDLLHLMVCL